MRKISLLAALLTIVTVLAFPAASHAQGWPGPPPGAPGGGKHGFGGPGGRGGHGLARLIAALGLTPTQVAELKPIFDASRAKAQALRADTSLTPQQKFAKMKRLHDWQNAKIAPFLKPSQLAKWKSMLAKQATWEHGPGATGGPGGPGGHRWGGPPQ